MHFNTKLKYFISVFFVPHIREFILSHMGMHSRDKHLCHSLSRNTKSFIKIVLSITSMLKSAQIGRYSRFKNSSFANLFFKMEWAWAPWNVYLARLGILSCSTGPQWHWKSSLSLDALSWTVKVIVGI